MAVVRPENVIKAWLWSPCDPLPKKRWMKNKTFNIGMAMAMAIK